MISIGHNSSNLVWLRLDLRLTDNQALAAARSFPFSFTHQAIAQRNMCGQVKPKDKFVSREYHPTNDRSEYEECDSCGEAKATEEFGSPGHLPGGNCCGFDIDSCVCAACAERSNREWEIGRYPVFLKLPDGSYWWDELNQLSLIEGIGKQGTPHLVSLSSSMFNITHLDWQGRFVADSVAPRPKDAMDYF